MVVDNNDEGSSSDESSSEEVMDEGKVERVRGVLRREDVHTKFETLKKLRAQGVKNKDGLEVCLFVCFSI